MTATLCFSGKKKKTAATTATNKKQTKKGVYVAASYFVMHDASNVRKKTHTHIELT